MLNVIVSGMKIYTSYFANWKKLREAGVVMLSIASAPPRWFTGRQLSHAAPKRFPVRESNVAFECRYREEVLRRINPHLFIDSLEHFGLGHDVALCCYERPEVFCHRHLLAEWLTEHTGVEIIEFGYVPKRPEPVQLSLF